VTHPPESRPCTLPEHPVSSFLAPEPKPQTLFVDICKLHHCDAGCGRIALVRFSIPKKLASGFLFVQRFGCANKVVACSIDEGITMSVARMFSIRLDELVTSSSRRWRYEHHGGSWETWREIGRWRCQWPLTSAR
jgi:hypothetical protein